MGNKIIDEEPTATIAATNIQLEYSEEPEEVERLFHSQLWVEETPLHFIIDNGSQKNLISIEVRKILNLATVPHPQPYNIGWLSHGRDIYVSQQCLLSYNINPFKY